MGGSGYDSNRPTFCYHSRMAFGKRPAKADLETALVAEHEAAKATKLAVETDSVVLEPNERRPIPTHDDEW